MLKTVIPGLERFKPVLTWVSLLFLPVLTWVSLLFLPVSARFEQERSSPWGYTRGIPPGCYSRVGVGYSRVWEVYSRFGRLCGFKRFNRRIWASLSGNITRFTVGFMPGWVKRGLFLRVFLLFLLKVDKCVFLLESTLSAQINTLCSKPW